MFSCINDIIALYLGFSHVAQACHNSAVASGPTVEYLFDQPCQFESPGFVETMVRGQGEETVVQAGASRILFVPEW